MYAHTFLRQAAALQQDCHLKVKGGVILPAGVGNRCGETCYQCQWSDAHTLTGGAITAWHPRHITQRLIGFQRSIKSRHVSYSLQHDTCLVMMLDVHKNES